MGIRESSVYAFAYDLVDEGVDRALDRMLGSPGPSGVSVAAVYHTSRDVFPHNPRRKVAFLDPGTYFRPDPARYPGTTVRPEPSALCSELDPLALVREATAARGAGLHAWVVYLHDVPAGFSRPDVVQRNVFGDPMRTDLCPANPDVRTYAVAMTRDLARYGCDSVVAESLHYAAFRHGYHHERCLVPLSPLSELLLGLCFCDHCVAHATDRGVDAEGLRDWCRDEVERELTEEGDGTHGDLELNRPAVAALAGGELGAYLEARTQVISSLGEEIVAALDGSGTRFCFQDPTGSVKGYVTGEPQGGAAVDIGWQFGIDPARLGQVVHEYRLLGYAREPGRLDLEVRAARDRLGPEVPLGCVVRPAPPDSDGATALSTKLSVLADAGIMHVGFYHYGLLPLCRIGHIHEAIASSASTPGGNSDP